MRAPRTTAFLLAFPALFGCKAATDAASRDVPAECSDSCRDTQTIEALDDVLWDFESGELAAETGSSIDVTADCDGGGSGHLTGTRTDSGGTVTLDLTITLSQCRNKTDGRDVNFTGDVHWAGSHTASGGTLTVDASALVLSGSVTFSPAPERKVDETCVVTLKKEASPATDGHNHLHGTITGTFCGRTRTVYL